MRPARNTSLRRKLTVIIMLTSVVALLVAIAGFATYEWVTFRRTMVDDRAMLARIVGGNCAAAITFDDAKSAERTLASLKAEPHLMAACIFTTDNRVFASYVRRDLKGWVPPKPSASGEFFADDHLALYRPVIHNGEWIGTVYLQEDLVELHERFTRYAGIGLVVLLVSLFAALMLSSRLQRLVSEPILHLAQTAKDVSVDRHYEVRAPRSSGAPREVGTLIDAFNEMLAQIQNRDKALQESEQHFRSLIENGNDLITILDRNSRIRYVSPSAKRILGFAPDELIGAYALDYIHADDAKTVSERLRQLAEAPGRTASAEYRCRRKDGSWIYVESKARNLLGDPSVAGIIINSRDVTERKQAEEQLRLQSAALEAAANAILITDSQGIILWVNPAFTFLTGHSREEVIGKTPRTLNSGKHDSNFYRELWETVTAGHVWHGEMINRRKDGSLYDIEMTVTPVRDGTGNISRFVAINQDITERKRAQMEMENLHRQLLDVSRCAGMAEVATNVLHNVGNVLNSVNVSAALVSEKVQRSKLPNLAKAAALMREHENDLAVFLAKDPKGTQLVSYLGTLAQHLGREQAEILQELESLNNNIDHIKEIVTMQQSYASASGIIDTLPIVDLVEDALRMNNGALARHEVHVVREYIATPSVPVDKHKVLQILVNLVRNAKYALDDGGGKDKRLTVRVGTDGDGFVKISIIDNGVGILPKNLTRIFSHGFTTRKAGHGFGLHSGALAAKDMGGSLSAHSDGPGQGATFTLSLPLRQECEKP